MNQFGTTFSVTALANAIACKLSNEEIELFASMLNQLGYTLETIVSQRELCKSKENLE